MKRIENFKSLIILYVLFSLFFGILLRVYNLTFEDLWFDEMVSFWVSDPSITFKESYIRNNLIEGHPFLFNFLLKIIFNLFGYDPNLGRYFSCILSILSIFSVTYISKILSKDKSYLLTMFLISTNVFLIIYSQEARVFMLMFFLVSINLIFFFKTLESDELKIHSKKIIFLFIATHILMVLSNPFTLIISFSIILFSSINYLKFKTNIKSVNFSMGIIVLFIIFYLPYYLFNTLAYDDFLVWIEHPSVKFYTNFCFSKFFGSRLLGIIHLIFLIGLIIKFKDQFVKLNDKKTILLIIIFLSYFLPITFGYIHYPILNSRYIIFVLIPIILIISHLIFEIKNIHIKRILISILVLFTLANQWTETNIKQFFKERGHHKSDLTSSFKYINNSRHLNFTFDTSFTEKNKEIFYKTINNYSKTLIEKSELNISILEDLDLLLNNNNSKNIGFKKFDLDYIWIICMVNLSKSKCSNLEINHEYFIVEEKNFIHANLKLIKFY